MKSTTMPRRRGPGPLTIQRRGFVRTLAHGARRDEAGVRWHDLADLYR